MVMTPCSMLGKLIRSTLPRTSSALQSGMSSSKNSSAVISRVGTLAMGDLSSRKQSNSNARVSHGALLSLSAREPAVERPVLNRLGDVGGAEVGGALEVGQGAGDLEDAVEGAGGEAEALEGLVEEAVAGGAPQQRAWSTRLSHGEVCRGGGLFV